MTSVIWDLASFIIALGILVTVHEFGHFWVARRCGVKVEKFSIGFGKAIWSSKGKDGTEYTLAIIPLGGFVKMLDGRVEDVAESEQHLAFDRKPLWQRSAVVAAGPIFNFIFAIFAYWLVFLIGVPSIKPVIGEVTPQSIVAQAGIESGMELKSISGIKTPDWESVNMQLVSHIGDPSMQVTVVAPGEIDSQETKTLNLQTWRFDPETQSVMRSLGFKPFTPQIQTTIYQVTPNGAAEHAGMLAGDEIVKINDKVIHSWQQIAKVIQANPEKTMAVVVERQNKQVSLELTPKKHQGHDHQVIGFAGIAPTVTPWPESYRFNQQYGVIDSIGKAVNKTGQVITLTITMLKKLIVGDLGLNNLSGPISIAKGAGATANYGLVYFLGFLALISVNLGIINLVPLPILDGGHLLFFAIEAIIRRPVPEKIQEMGYKFGGAVLFALMALALFNDFTRL